MPYVPFIHPDSDTIAYRFMPADSRTPPFHKGNIWTSSDGQSAEEIDAAFFQNWPEQYLVEYLRDHGASELDLDCILPSRVPPSPVNQQEPL
jgi:hypothetical protein